MKNYKKNVRFLLYLNPLAHLIEAYRNVLFYHQMPNMLSLAYVSVLSFIILIQKFLYLSASSS